jgi:hypothetical protein
VREHRSQIHPLNAVAATECLLQFSLGISKRLHAGHDGAGNAVRNPPIIHPVFPARGPGRQVVYNTQYEHLDLLSPAPLETSGGAIKEALLQAPDFPLLLESSSFLTSPILHDVNGDGITDVILSDYDGVFTWWAWLEVLGTFITPRYPACICVGNGSLDASTDSVSRPGIGKRIGGQGGGQDVVVVAPKNESRRSFRLCCSKGRSCHGYSGKSNGMRR